MTRSGILKVASGYFADSFVRTLSRAAGGSQNARIALKATGEFAFMMVGEEYPIY